MKVDGVRAQVIQEPIFLGPEIIGYKPVQTSKGLLSFHTDSLDSASSDRFFDLSSKQSPVKNFTSFSQGVNLRELSQREKKGSFQNKLEKDLSLALMHQHYSVIFP